MVLKYVKNKQKDKHFECVCDFIMDTTFEQLDVEQSEVDGNWYLKEECPHKTDEEKAKEEHERLDMLFMTGSDVERAIYKVKGIDFDDILAMVKDNPAIDAKALKIEFKANNFYRGNPYISQVGALLGFTSEQLDKFFDTKDYHYLNTCKLTIKPTPEEATVTIVPNPTPYGKTAHYKVECEGYMTQEGDVKIVEDTELGIELEAIEETEETKGKTEATDKDNLTVGEE